MISFWNFKTPSARQQRGLEEEDDDDDEDSNRASKSNGGASSLGDCSAVRAFPSKGSTFFIGRRSRGGRFVVGPSEVVVSLCGAREERRRPAVVGPVLSAGNHVRGEERKVLRGARGKPSTTSTTTTATTSTPMANVETKLPPETLII